MTKDVSSVRKHPHASLRRLIMLTVIMTDPKDRSPFHFNEHLFFLSFRCAYHSAGTTVFARGGITTHSRRKFSLLVKLTRFFGFSFCEEWSALAPFCSPPLGEKRSQIDCGPSNHSRLPAVPKIFKFTKIFENPRNRQHAFA